MEYLGLLFEVLLFLLGLYLYLFATGRLRSKDEKLQKRADNFRRQNAWWLRVGALALMALMAVNIYLHLRQLL